MTHVHIAGAGLGGLTAAIALVQRGFEVDVFEQASELREVGAGLTVSRSAQKVLADLGVLDRVLAEASLTPVMAFLHYRDGRLLAGAHDFSDGRWSEGAPEGGIHIHRADMHAILVARFAELAPGRLHLGKALTAFEDNGSVVRSIFSDGTDAHAGMLIGADGVRSIVRAGLWETPPPRFTGQLAYRFMLPGEIAALFLSAGRAAVYLGPERVFNRYTLRGGEIVNCVAITKSDGWTEEGWSTPAEPEELLALYGGWHPEVLKLMSLAPQESLIKWALFDRPSLPRWGKGRVTLLGDAAHPMMPFLGLGAAMAMEDGMVLARALESLPVDAARAAYEDHRRPRTDQIADLSRVQGEASQARDPDNYDPKSAPAQDAAIQAYDPVTAVIP